MAAIRVRVIADRMLSDFMNHMLATEPDLEVVDLGADVTVIDAASSSEGWAPAVDEAQRGSPGSRVVLLADDDGAGSAVAAARAGVVAWMAPGAAVEELVSVVRSVAAGAGHFPAQHLGDVLRALREDVAEPRDAADQLSVLTERERDVLRFLVEGLAAREIAERMHLSVNTVRTHTQRLFRKLGVHHRLEAVRLARNLGLEPGSPDDVSE